MSTATAFAYAPSDADADADAVAVESPVLRRLPLPVPEPQPALRLVARPGLARYDQDALVIEADGPDNWPASAYERLGRRPVPCLPEPHEWATRFVQAAVEVAAGLRPAAQLIRWTSTDVQATMARRHQIAARLRQRAGGTVDAHRARVRAVLPCSPRPGIIEVAAVVQDHERVRAVALRMEAVRTGGWRVTAFELG